MCKVGAIGVDQRLYDALHSFAAQARRGTFTCTNARAELDAVLRSSPHQPKWVVAISVGVACAAFGRLLAVDWVALIPIFTASCLAQLVRDQLRVRYVNVFVSAVVVAFIGSTVAGFGCRMLGSSTVPLDIIVLVAFAAKAILAMFAITQSASSTNDAQSAAMAFGLRVVFTLGALGTGVAIPALFFRSRQPV